MVSDAAGRPGFLVTVDVEDHAIDEQHRRFDRALEPLLTALRARNLTATFFVVGGLARAWRSELLSLVEEGHEIGLHGHTHQFIDRLGEEGFAEDVARGNGTLGEILGQAPRGYRAPYFSLTRKTLWAPDVLTNAGFIYSSSVLPAWNPQAGFPGAPRSAFKWPGGLIEFPVPVTGVGQLRVPILGGAYLRLAPDFVVRAVASRLRLEGQWTYAHPYDFDVAEVYSPMPGQPRWMSRLLHARRHLMLDRVMSLAGSQARTLGSMAEDSDFTDLLGEFSINVANR